MKALALLCFSIGIALLLNAQTNAPEPSAASAGGTPSPSAPTPDDSNSLASMPPLTVISSDSGEISMKTGTRILRGHVHIEDPKMDLRCDLLIMEEPRLSEGKFIQASALTNVIIEFTREEKTHRAVADSAVYTYSTTNSVTNSLVVLRGNPVVITRSDGMVMKCDPFVWNRITDTYQFHNQQFSGQLSDTNSLDLFSTPNPFNTGPSKPKTDGAPK